MAQDRFGHGTEQVDWNQYGKGNAWVWGKMKGEDDLMNLGRRAFDFKSDIKRYEKDPGFQDFVNATDTKGKLKILKKHFPKGPKSMSLWDYNPEGGNTWDWDATASDMHELFRRHDAILEGK